MLEKKLLKLKDKINKNNTVNQDLYSKFDVKRGLRNADGSGVLAGLSHISSVIGTIKDDSIIKPIEGTLKYRGIRLRDIMTDHIEENHFNFEKISFLLLVGEFPNSEELDAIKQYMAQHRELPTKIITNIIEGLPSKNVMNKIQTCIAALYSFDENPDTLDPYENFLKSLRIIAKLPIILSYSYLTAYKKDPKLIPADPSMSTAEAFLYTLSEGKDIDPFQAHIMDVCLILHAEHGGGNNSTFSMKVVSSSGTDIYSAIAAAVASLKGPLHGAANRKVMSMINDIKNNLTDINNETEIESYLEKLVNKEAGDKSGKLYGLGHAVYTKSDPRALAIKHLAIKIATEKNREKDYKLYTLIEELGPKVFTKVKGSTKVISPNVDFFSGFVYDCLNIPVELYTPLFAMARAVGWCSHRIEESLSGKRIIRPGYKYVGNN
tara:strand:+ start:578 stop:1882 length:1305 start_codon:yes stop_codon:yes gene_type:complete